MTNFEQALPVILRHEGATYTDDPDDDGGPTKYGIALNEDDLSPWLHRPATAQDIESMTPGFAGEIYKANYWDKMCLDDIKDYRVALVLFDQCVVAGKYGVTSVAQGIVGSIIDGAMGPKSVLSINLANPLSFCNFFLIKMADHYEGVVNRSPKNNKFLQGWLNRLTDLKASIGLTGQLLPHTTTPTQT